jgi:hypothetical protein
LISTALIRLGIFDARRGRGINEYAQRAPVVQRVADAERALNEHDCDFTLRRERVAKSAKVRTNHTCTITNALPTTCFVQAFDVTKLAVLWAMNRQVALADSAHAWAEYEDSSLMLMDAYCVHMATDAPAETERVWLRLSFEVPQFDRLGNGHNPFFSYDWAMVPMDIEQLGLVPYDAESDWTLRVFS